MTTGTVLLVLAAFLAAAVEGDAALLCILVCLTLVALGFVAVLRRRHARHALIAASLGA
jgi:hypothetical protein